MGETVRLVETHDGGTLIILESGKKIPADTVRLSAGRQGGTDELHLDLAGLSGDKRGRIDVNDHFQAEVDDIYAVGDVIGFPALAATAMEQGRRGCYLASGEPSVRNWANCSRSGSAPFRISPASAPPRSS